MDKCKISIIENCAVLTGGIAKTQTAKKDGVSSRAKTIITILIYLVAIPVVLIVGVVLFKDKKYNIISIAVAVLSCVPFFIGFEKSKTGARELVVIAVMTAISVVGRLIFAPIPGFKPVTAIVIITAIAFGAQAGFLTGSMSAIVSNIYFGQGPWTPFQMFVWGAIGLICGLITKRNKNPNIILLIISGILGGVMFSLLMDIWTVLSIDQTFNLARYIFFVSSSLPFMATYAVSNVVFLLVLTKPILEKLNRVKQKYGLFAREKTEREK